jgi:hypothetical protein
VIEQSESITALAAAMSKVQASVEGAVKGKANPAFKGTKYADLRSVWDACREALADNGMSVLQFPGEMVDGRMTLTTQLCHESGEWMRAPLSIPLSKVDAQGYGSAVTYARRYALAAVVGVCPEDDDGNAASAPRGRQIEAVESLISEDQRNILMTMAEQSGADMRGFCTYYKIEALPDLPAARYDHAFALLTKKLNEKTERIAA